MCLGLPGRVIAVRGSVAEVDFWGRRQSIRLDELSEPVTPGDTIITHSGSAVRKIAAQDVADTMALYESVSGECDVERIPV
jgi:hydrogenase expression/formation protein HypC